MKVAALQHRFYGSREETIAYIRQEVLKLAGSVDLIALQELHQSAYFCQYESADLFDLAESFEADIALFSDLAKQANVVLVTSLFEKRAKGLYHNTAVVFERDGSIAGKYRKMHIPDDPSFYEKFYFTPGDLGFTPIQTSLGRLGVLVCWDQWYPEAARIMALKGADLLIYPTAIGFTPSDSNEEKSRQLQAWQIIQRAHSVANALPLIAINRVGFELDSSGAGEGIEFFGHSFISGAQGEILAQAQSEQASLVCEIDLNRTQAVRQIWPFLRDRRIESYGEILQRFCD
ncbi:carbon-nitrogen hydrolase [Helicobacter sp. XJK30-2]|uniref:Carbon-nitrogen hydrolase n=1 Tax=Helicobacter zhangjianzhongii TaxID=2974574 RepID=A0ACC6FSE0_9HELI|nr:carbon-nitrogen hydrolase [Helicobacter sp. CPD2-1]MDL0082090.1 carbon-nitrogen hydrolase [Helicobacter sp. XJK30-2]